MGSIKLNGDTSGHVEITAPAVAGTTSVEFPTDVVLQTQMAAELVALPGRNLLTNGAFNVWQRGTSHTFAPVGADYFKADRWLGYCANAANVTVDKGVTGADVANGNYALIKRTAGQTGVDAAGLWQALETVDSLALRNRTVTLSFWARKGANYSGSTLNWRIRTGKGTDQSSYTVMAGQWTGAGTPGSDNVTPTTEWVRYQGTANIPADVTQVGVGFYTGDFVGTAGADDSVHVTGVQLELGDTATAYDHRDYGTELARCQRYYYQLVSGANQWVGGGWYDTATTLVAYVRFPVTMRGIPTITSVDGSAYWWSSYNGTWESFDAIGTLSWASPTGTAISASSGVSGAANAPCLVGSSNAAARLGFSADL